MKKFMEFVLYHIAFVFGYLFAVLSVGFKVGYESVEQVVNERA